MLDALAVVGPTGVQLLAFFCFSISVISCYRVLIVVSSLYLFDIYVLGDAVCLQTLSFLSFSLFFSKVYNLVQLMMI